MENIFPMHVSLLTKEHLILIPSSQKCKLLNYFTNEFIREGKLGGGFHSLYFDFFFDLKVCLVLANRRHLKFRPCNR